MTSKLLARADAKVRLLITGSRIREALVSLHELQSVEMSAALEQHELMNLETTERRLGAGVKRVRHA